jgi:hypothetical protein
VGGAVTNSNDTSSRRSVAAASVFSRNFGRLGTAVAQVSAGLRSKWGVCQEFCRSHVMSQVMSGIEIRPTLPCCCRPLAALQMVLCKRTLHSRQLHTWTCRLS